MNQKYIKTIALSAITASCAVSNQNSLAFWPEAWSIAKGAFGYLDTFASKGFGYAHFLWFFRDIKNVASGFFDWLYYKLHKTSFRSPKETEKILTEDLKKLKVKKKQKRNNTICLKRCARKKQKLN